MTRQVLLKQGTGTTMRMTRETRPTPHRRIPFHTRISTLTNSWNKYTQVASRAIRQALTETDRVAAERRAQIGVRYQLWENGKAGETVRFLSSVVMRTLRIGNLEGRDKGGGIWC